ncbi:6-bladed beta-propeller [Candidatus Palauibacter sp.]|uniref:6-bladed beta-propeller n=1 Tax=Candidatus Palauibacter sp. TaxID=3101350 RepID=UPI003D0D0868
MTSTRVLRGVCLILLPLLTGCEKAVPEGVNHPLPEALAQIAQEATAFLSPDTVPSTRMTDDARARWTQLRHRILQARPGAIIGALDGNGVDVLAELTEVVIPASGEIYVLDGRNGRVIVFDSAGVAVHWFGRIGDGPNEFRLPAPIQVLGDTLLMGQVGAVKTFTRGLAGFEWYDQETIETVPFSMCASDGRIFLGGHREPEGMVRQYRPSGGVPFGSGYLFGSPGVQRSLSEGIITCENDADVVVYGHRHSPSLVAYSYAGRKAWSTSLSDYVQGYWLEVGSLRGAPVPPRETLSRLLPTGVGFLMASYYRELEMGESGVRTYLLDFATGEGGLLEESSPNGRILAMNSDLYVRSVPGPYPRLQIWHMEQG